MPLIELTTIINAPVERCFDLSRSIDLHKISTKATHEEAIAGVTSGLIGKGVRVTWRARHFGITQPLTSEITQFEYPWYFRDEMIDGAFKMIRHDHLFEKSGDKTVMRDKFQFASPGSIFGIIFNQLVLTRYLRNLLAKRNQIIKEVIGSLNIIPGFRKATPWATIRSCLQHLIFFPTPSPRLAQLYASRVNRNFEVLIYSSVSVIGTYPPSSFMSFTSRGT